MTRLLVLRIDWSQYSTFTPTGRAALAQIQSLSDTRNCITRVVHAYAPKPAGAWLWGPADDTSNEGARVCRHEDVCELGWFRSVIAL